MIHLGRDKWLFAGVFAVHGLSEERRNKEGERYFMYETTELKGLEHLTGRAIVQFDKGFRASYLIGKNYGDKLVVTELRDQRMSVGDFPGYNAVLLPYHLLGTIVREELPSWKSALSNVSGVYIITDIKTGKPYVGSAYGGEGIWPRWAVYARTGHGDNKEIKELLNLHGADYLPEFPVCYS